jgi:hypothetical protein
MRRLPGADRSDERARRASPQRRAAEKTATGPVEMSVCLIHGASPYNAGPFAEGVASVPQPIYAAAVQQEEATMAQRNRHDDPACFRGHV